MADADGRAERSARYEGPEQADDTTLWQRAWRIGERSLESGAADPLAWALAECGDDEALRDAVETLLAYDEAPRAAWTEELLHTPGTVGPYALLHEIGRGGMGLVYKARHRDLERMAALKVLTTGVAVPAEHLRRFEREARLLASLDHPSIVRLFEAGRAIDADGRPLAWFAMELVEPRRSLLDHFGGRDVEPDEWTALFRQAAEAIGHAHRAGVLHRDIKPENLLVDTGGRVRVIDFGIGATLRDDSAAPKLTGVGHLVGTLNYLPPERLDGFDATPQSDVYALGLVFEEAVTGQARFGFSSTPSGIASLREAQRRLAPTLSSSVPAELGWIIGKASDPDPARRYADAGELADDLLRLQRSEPLVAGPSGAGYRIRLFVQRHRALVAATSAVVFVLAAGLIAVSSALVRESRALERERDARRTAEDAAYAFKVELVANENLVDFWRDVFERAPIETTDGEPYTFEAAMDDAYRQALTLVDDPGDIEQRARILTVLGSVFAVRQDWERAVALFEPASELFRSSGSLWTEPWLDNAVEHHAALLALGRSDEASSIVDRLRELPADAALSRSRWLGELATAARAIYRLGLRDDAAELFEYVAAVADRDVPRQRTTALSATHNLATAIAMTDPKRALALYREIWDWRSIHEPEIPRSYRSVRNGVELLLALGRPGEALAWADEALALADAHAVQTSLPDYLDVVENRARALIALGREDEGVEILERVLATRRESSGERDPDVMASAGQLAFALERVGRYEEANAIHADQVDLRAEEWGPFHEFTLRHRKAIAGNLLELGRVDQALVAYEELVPILLEHLGVDNFETIDARSELAVTVSELGRHAEAANLGEALLNDIRASDDVYEVEFARQLAIVARIQSADGRHERALDNAEHSIAIFSALPDRLQSEIWCRAALALVLARADRPDRSLAELETAIAIAAMHGLDPPDEVLEERVRTRHAPR